MFLYLYISICKFTKWKNSINGIDMKNWAKWSSSILLVCVKRPYQYNILICQISKPLTYGPNSANRFVSWALHNLPKLRYNTLKSKSLTFLEWWEYLALNVTAAFERGVYSILIIHFYIRLHNFCPLSLSNIM